MSLGPCSTALLASLAKGFGFFANLNSSLSCVSHMQDKESCILLSELSSALLWDPGAPSRQGHSAGSQGLLEQGTKAKGRVKKAGLALILGCTPTASAALTDAGVGGEAVPPAGPSGSASLEHLCPHSCC